ncbi:OsmC family protein [Wenyingzhuangia marina]|uniref:Putative redox protein n=1 Tax=Wenyingzhuangia marina TaxID=1195760 RepID=A0A1M5TVV0_9FLAO|nr:OsmC family protein [Wenyingzhuangia marina]GGF70802.1 hypothetical protein GCM10011397_12200 [Wenyingzhuangia marina]SHH54818.1 putative redox protein [Wenyingzhuangia marina]
MNTVSASIGTQLYKTEIKTNNHLIIADEPEKVGGQDLGFTPTELLNSSLAACSAITIRMYAERKGWDVQHININVKHKINTSSETITFEKEIEVIGNLDAAQKKRLVEIGEKCPVEKMLKGDIKVVSSLKE